MNERIRELAVESGFATGYDRTQTGKWSLADRELEKFAELIVQECVSIVDNKIEVSRYVHEAELLRECSTTIKQHFGVEE